MEHNKMQIIQITQKEIWQASHHIVYKNKTKYNRKDKHRSAYKDGSSLLTNLLTRVE